MRGICCISTCAFHCTMHITRVLVTFTGSGATLFVEFILIFLKLLQFSQLQSHSFDLDESWIKLHDVWGAELFKPVLNVVRTQQRPADVVLPA